MPSLVDPRAFGGPKPAHPLAGLVTDAASPDAARRDTARTALRRWLRGELVNGAGDSIRVALESQPNALCYRLLWDEIAQVVESDGGAPGGIVARSFALPIVLVAAATRKRRIPGALDDIGAVSNLLRRHGALGPADNIGFSNALCTYEALSDLPPETILRAARDLSAEPISPRLGPAEILVEPGREQAHLRYLVGAGVMGAERPSVPETAANIGAWGIALSRLLGEQLAVADVQLLALPRRPKGLMHACQTGREAQLDVALNLFVSNAVRRCRAAAGDPVAILSTHDNADLRVTLSAPFAPEMVEGFRWPLNRLDRLYELQERIVQLMLDVRVNDVRVVPEILPSLRSGTGYWYPRADEWDRLMNNSAQH